LALTLSSAAAKTKIVYWHTHGGKYKEVTEAIAAKFSEMNPDIEVEPKFVAYGGGFQSYDKLLAAIAAGDPPDVSHFERSLVVDWVASKAFMPLDDYLTDEEKSGEMFLPAAWREVALFDKVWAMPFNTDIRGFLWNKGLFKKAGLDPDIPPKTLEELDAFAEKTTKYDETGKKVEEIGFIPWTGNWYFPAWSWTFGGKLYDYDTRKATFTDPENLAALEWMVSYAKKYDIEVVASFSAGFTGGVSDPFFMGFLAMEANGNWQIGNMKQYAPDIDYGVAEVPHPPGGTNGTWCGGFSHVVPRGVKHPDEAAKFVRWMGSKEAQMIWYKELVSTPTNIEALKEAIEIAEPKDRIFMEQWEIANGRYPLWMHFFLECLPMVENAIHFKKTPEQALADTQAIVQRGLDELFASMEE
jgi:multiple sugar transport system substrate-binding protein